MAEKKDRPPLAVAFEWISKITTVALEMVVPGIIGAWLDRRWGTNYITLIGLAVGVVGGIWHLIILTGTGNDSASSRPKSEKDQDVHANETE